MIFAARSLFLLLLLAVDWAGDPHQGYSTFSAPMASQEVVPVWTAYRHEIRVRISPLPRATAALDRADLFLPAALPHVLVPASAPAAQFQTDSLYVFMSLQR
jgi:hypothetical protein